MKNKMVLLKFGLPDKFAFFFLFPSMLHCSSIVLQTTPFSCKRLSLSLVYCVILKVYSALQELVYQ